MTTLVERFEDLGDRYAAAFVDLWGCMHDGVRAHIPAVQAMQAFRERREPRFTGR